MDSRIETQSGIETNGAESSERKPVSYSRIDVEPATGPQCDQAAEEFEIGIGAWRAKIVKQQDGNAGRPRFWTRFDAPPREVWTRRRMQRLAERLNARRRLSD